MLSVIGWIFFALGLLVGVLVIPFGIPGTFIIVAVSFLAGLATHFQAITWPFLGALLAISLGVELIEFVLGALSARKFGSSKWGMWGSILGGLFFAIWATPLSPVIGTIFGAFIGAFVGAFVFEFLRFGDLNRALRSGWGSFLGAITGRLLKLVVAIVMVVLIAVRLL